MYDKTIRGASEEPALSMRQLPTADSQRPPQIEGGIPVIKRALSIAQSRLPALLGVVCLAVVCVILSLGLWPFHASRNDVAWLRNTNGVKLGRTGNLSSSGLVDLSDSGRMTMEMWVQPDHWQNSATILSLYRPDRRILFSYRQSLTDLEVAVLRWESPRSFVEREHFYVDGFVQALHQHKPVFITVTSDPEAIAVYLDGRLAQEVAQFPFPGEVLDSRLIVGDAPRQTDSFRGYIRGLATYATVLNSEQISRHFQSWTRQGAPVIEPEDSNSSLYLFDERTGNIVHNRAAKTGDLIIPAVYTNVDKITLEPFWSEFEWSRSYWSGNVKNVIGFVPFGMCFYPFFLSLGVKRRAALITVLAGALVSLLIEFFQAFLPTRDSGTTDIITNTFGAYIGIMLYRATLSLIRKRFPDENWLPYPE